MGNTKYSTIWGCATIGIEALPVEVETFISAGLPRHTVVGLPRGAVRECLDRIWAAFRSSGMSVPRGAITINLAPADVRKDGTAFDLPVALAIVAADQQIKWHMDPANAIVIGELALDGSIRPVRGVLSMALQARADGRKAIIVPSGNGAEASMVSGLDVYAVGTLTEAIDVLRTSNPRPGPIDRSEIQDNRTHPKQGIDFAEVRGQYQARRALEIASAGGHNVLMIGPPGSGKTMLARRIPSILPEMGMEETIESTRIHSVSGCLMRDAVISQRPFRAPHQTISYAGLVGGGTPLKPGEISLAHNGVLFLDELPEFSRNALESLRQPMESGTITLSRVASRYTFPARFMLITAMNPCPCGYHGSDRTCQCSEIDVIRYRNRISGPLLDRIDLHLEVGPIDPERMRTRHQTAESSEDIRTRVQDARLIQKKRFEEHSGLYSNADINAGKVEALCNPTDAARGLIIMAMHKMGLSLRGFHSVLRVARTISDLAGRDQVDEAAVAEAIQYRPAE